MLKNNQSGDGIVDIDSSAENDFIGKYLNNIYSDNSAWTGIYQENDNSNWKANVTVGSLVLSKYPKPSNKVTPLEVVFPITDWPTLS